MSLIVKMLTINRIKEVISSVDNRANLVVASKYYDADEIKLMYEQGIIHFGENRGDSFLKKYQELKELDIKWHFIGHLQTNKVKDIINKIDYLHSLDSLHLANYIERYRIGVLDCFIQIKLVDNENKYGISFDEALALLDSIKDYKTINVIGLMTIIDADLTDIEKGNLYRKLSDYRQVLQKMGYNKIKELSMGMSNDYKIAIDNGATYVRLGQIFKWE